jgi:hypothetical protein
MLEAVSKGGTGISPLAALFLGVRLSKVLGDGDGGVSDWRKPELVVESVS